MNTLSRILLTLSVASSVLILHFLPSIASTCEFEWMEIGKLFTYRLVTCHALHWSWNHLVWDLLMFSILGAICEYRSRKQYIFYLASSSILIPLVVIACHPELSTYRGLSGIDSGLFSLLAVNRIRDSKREHDTRATLVFSLCVILLIAKITLEMLNGNNIFVSDSSFVPVPIAHLTGALVGTITSLFSTEEPHRSHWNHGQPVGSSN